MEELVRKFKTILNGSKQYEFTYGVNGMTVLEITSYYTGERIRLDLSVLLDNEEVLQDMVELAKEGDEEDE